MRYQRELRDSQWLAPSQLNALQQEKLNRLFAHAAANTNFYRDRFAAHQFNIHTDDPASELKNLPLLDKQTIRDHCDNMVWPQTPGGVYPYHTGGSSGEPLKFFIDKRRQAYDQAARMRSHEWFDVHVGNRELYLWGSPIEHTRTDTIKRMRDWITNHRLLNAFEMSPDRMDAYLDRLERFQPTSIYGYPSSIALLAERGLEKGRTLKLPSLKAIFVTGEICYPHHRDTISEYFLAPVTNGYGSREAGFIAHECPEGNLHVTSENVFVEIIRYGQRMPIGQAGEIVVTHLDAYGMPMIRYQTGDIGKLKPGRCACGRGLPMMDVVEGRTTDFLYLPDGSIKHALSIIYPLRELKGVRQFRVLQQADFSVTVDIVCENRKACVTREAVARSVLPVLGHEVDLQIDLVDRIPVTRSGKFHYVTSNVSLPTITIPQEICRDG